MFGGLHFKSAAGVSETMGLTPREQASMFLTHLSKPQRLLEVKLALLLLMVYYAAGSNALSELCISLNDTVLGWQMFGMVIEFPDWALAPLPRTDPLLYVTLRLVLFTAWMLIVYALFESASDFFKRGSQTATAAAALAFSLLTFQMMNWLASRVLLVSIAIVAISIGVVLLTYSAFVSLRQRELSKTHSKTAEVGKEDETPATPAE